MAGFVKSNDLKPKLTLFPDLIKQCRFAAMPDKLSPNQPRTKSNLVVFQICLEVGPTVNVNWKDVLEALVVCK